MMDKEKIAQKIKYLFSLGASSNQAESESAIRKAHELIIKYNILASELEEKSNYIQKHIQTYYCSRFVNREEAFACLILTEFFNVVAFYNRRVYDTGTKMLSREFEYEVHRFLYGTEENVIFAEYLYHFLIRSFKESYKQENKYMNILRNRDIKKTSFYQGMYDSICAKLYESEKIIEQEEGIVLRKDPALEVKMGNMKVTTSTFDTSSHVDKGLGNIAGGALNLGRPLNNGIVTKLIK